MTKNVSERSTEEIKRAVKDAYEDLSNSTETGRSPQPTQSSCCGSSEPADSSQKLEKAKTEK